jgi:hypothetical protein
MRSYLSKAEAATFVQTLARRPPMLCSRGAVRAIAEAISARRITQAQAAEVIGIDPDQLAGILRGQCR